MDATDLDEATAEMVRALAPAQTRDWQVAAGALEWSCWTTAAHIAHDLLAYAAQVAGGAADGYLPLDLTVRAGTRPADLLRVVTACGRLLATTVTAAGPQARAWHWGATDPAGFAALGVNEVVVHTWDITQGLGVPWRPPESLCRKVVERMFPDAPAGGPVDALLWSTGRVALPGLPRRGSWVAKAAN